MTVSIIIPTFNEVNTLEKTLQSLAGPPAEIIVIDGGSTDDTVTIARRYTSNVLTSRKGRGIQQHAGACQSRGDVLIFVHADTHLPPGYQHLIHQALAHPGVVFGAFYLRIRPPKPPLDLIALGANLRSRVLSVPYGDQAIFVRRAAYFSAGGFNDLPVMEDVDLVRRLNRLGRFRMARGSVETSARRWEQENPLYTTLRNYSLIIRYLLGAHPHALAGRYPDIR